ncbi:MAG: response regulator transcription factor [Treponemataceae bacterium]
MEKQILLIEDEPGLRMTMCDRLEAEGYSVTTAETGLEGLASARDSKPDVIVLDVMLPGMDGFSVCENLRKEGNNTPIIMVTAKGQIEDKIVGFQLGADDYLPKPFEMPELLARIQVQVRRSEALKSVKAVSIKTKSSDVKIDLKRGFVTVKGTEIALLAQEIKLLEFFYSNEGDIVSREQLLQAVWGYEGVVSTRTIDVHVARLRQKLGDVGDVPKYIQTVRGVGYKFISP